MDMYLLFIRVSVFVIIFFSVFLIFLDIDDILCESEEGDFCNLGVDMFFVNIGSFVGVICILCILFGGWIFMFWGCFFKVFIFVWCEVVIFDWLDDINFFCGFVVVLCGLFIFCYNYFVLLE